VQSEYAPPSSEALLREFTVRHALKPSVLFSREVVAIYSTSIAHAVVNEAYARADDGVLNDPAVGLLLNMLHRNFEHVEAAVVAFVTGCGASAEVVARAATESSINILYILAGERAPRLHAYFEHYLDEVDRQVEKWRGQIVDLPPQAAAIQVQGAEKREAANDGLRQLIRSVMGSPMERWPKSLEKRFSGLGHGLAYRTFYARMSSETHADAEETLRYFVGRLHNDPTLLEAMALETTWTTRLYIHYAVSLFLKASIAYVESYSLKAAQAYLAKALADVDRELIDIGAHVGSGLFFGSTEIPQRSATDGT
jgi:hypothetical protein